MKRDKNVLYDYNSSNKFKLEDESLPNESNVFTIWRLFFTWLKIGFTSFGGGSVTQYLIQENFIYKYKWISAEEYANIIAIGQITPGINIFAYTILIGRKLAGWRGVVVSLSGLILPSAAVTVGISAVYINISKFPRVHSALNTGFAAIFGISLATNWRNVKPIFAKNYKGGALNLSSAVGIVISSIIIYIFINPPVVVLYIFGGICGAFSYWYMAKKKGGSQ